MVRGCTINDFCDTPRTIKLIYIRDMHEVLAVPEVLAIIFSFLDRNSYPKVASTCSVWREPALRLLWSQHAKLKHLLPLVGPVLWDLSKECVNLCRNEA